MRKTMNLANMAISYTCITLFVISIQLVMASGTEDVIFDDDPSHWPGHMKPLGTTKRKKEINVIYEYPKAGDFFSKYVKPRRPFLLKGGAKKHPAFQYWSDDYMASFPEVETESVNVFPNLKERREKKGYSMSVKKFLNMYRHNAFYMANSLPSFLLKDVLIPTPLKCSNTAELMTNHFIWMSSGGTKSVLHNDNADNIACLYRGSKIVFLIDPNKHNNKVLYDKGRGSYSSIDVEKVDFLKYPSLREVEFITAHLEEGDCLFIPYKWHQQINSFRGQDKHIIAVNIWFDHSPNHEPKDCELFDKDLALDRFFYHDEESSSVSNEDEIEFPLIDLFNYALHVTEDRKADLETFQKMLNKVPVIFNESPYDHLIMTKKFKEYGKELFYKLNVDKDYYFDYNDTMKILKDKKFSNELENWLEVHVKKMSNIISRQLVREDR